MKKLVVTFLMFLTAMTYAQDQKPQIPQVNVSGEGKVKVAPDQCVITLGVENTGKDAASVKKTNDETIDKVIKYIKKNNIPATDFQTTNVSLYKNYDYEKKKYNFHANQTITVLLKDIKKYDEFMMGITDTGITNINGIEFKSSKLEEHEREARKKAMLNAKQKANDFVSALGQKVGKLLLITDNSATHFPRPMYKGAMAEMAMADRGNKETLAIGEIEIVVNAQVAFAIE
ncbi:SIMPL domain-containing protein [Flavobacterium sp. H122]|uniref:SIMPL domain-containing protein n=1 Tax=Flavobacterium sp. H122 TaxID=2529860 RepID=UPI0010AA2C15|nr:SIMPL domain-containing protein [Flavobacterium sp. H122]